MIKTIQLTKEMIENGCRGENEVCPLALILPFRVACSVQTSYTELLYSDRTLCYQHNRDLDTWIRTFDQKRKVPEIELEIDKKNRTIHLTKELSKPIYQAKE